MLKLVQFCGSTVVPLDLVPYKELVSEHWWRVNSANTEQRSTFYRTDWATRNEDDSRLGLAGSSCNGILIGDTEPVT